MDRATAVIWKMMMVAEGQFRREQVPELMPAVYPGARHANGDPTEAKAGRVAARSRLHAI